MTDWQVPTRARLWGQRRERVQRKGESYLPASMRILYKLPSGAKYRTNKLVLRRLFLLPNCAAARHTCLEEPGNAIKYHELQALNSVFLEEIFHHLSLLRILNQAYKRLPIPNFQPQITQGSAYDAHQRKQVSTQNARWSCYPKTRLHFAMWSPSYYNNGSLRVQEPERTYRARFVRVRQTANSRYAFTSSCSQKYDFRSSQLPSSLLALNP